MTRKIIAVSVLVVGALALTGFVPGGSLFGVAKAFGYGGGTHTIDASVVASNGSNAGNGTISPEGAIVVNDGDSQTFTFTPDPGYFIAQVRVDNTLLGHVTSYTFNNVTEDHRIVVRYSHTSSSGGGNRQGGGGGFVLGASTGPGEVLGESVGPTHVFTVYMHYGSTGNDVMELQKILIARGYLHITAPTGWFGPLTQAAVKMYQAANGIPNTGYVGPLTLAALNAGK